MNKIARLIRSVNTILFSMVVIIFVFANFLMGFLFHKDESYFQEQYSGSVNLTDSGVAFSDNNNAEYHDSNANNNFNSPFKVFHCDGYLFTMFGEGNLFMMVMKAISIWQWHWLSCFHFSLCSCSSF